MQRRDIGRSTDRPDTRGIGAAPLSCVPDSLSVLRQVRSIIASAARPYVLTTEREISVLRRGLSKEGWKRALYLQPAPEHPLVYPGTGLLSIANRSLDREIEIPGPGGKIEDLYCDCGERLKILDQLRIAPEYPCPACGCKCSGERFDAAVRHLQHRALAGSALALALVYEIERDKDYADKGSEILLGYARSYPGPEAGSPSKGIIEQSAWEAAWAITLAQAYDMLYYSRILTEEDKEQINGKLFRPVAERLRAAGIQGHYGPWHLAGEGVIGFAIKDPALVEHALDSFRAVLADQVGDDGTWPESLHSHHVFALMGLIHLAEACSRSGIDIYNWQVRPGVSLKSMFAALPSTAYPSFRLPAIGPGQFHSILPLQLYEVASRRWNDPMFGWILKKGYKFREAPLNECQRQHIDAFTRSSFYAFLFGRDLPGRLAAPTLAGSDLPRLGICTLRNSSDQMLTFRYGKSAGEEHHDRLSFTLYANDCLLIPDYGTAAEGRPIVEWQKSTPAHNTVVVDRKNQGSGGQSALTRRCGGTYVKFVEGQARDLYPDVTHTRSILMLGQTSVISDHLTSPKEHDYDWFVRCEGKPEVDGEYGPSQLDATGYPLIKHDKSWKVERDCRIDVECENGTLSLGTWAQGRPMDAALGSCPTYTASRMAPLLMLRQHGKEARFVTVLAASRSGKADVAMEGRTIRIGSESDCDRVYVRDASAIGNDVLESDGDIAAVRIRGDEVQAIALLGGSWVRLLGEMLLECPAQVEFVEVFFDDRNLSINYSADTAGMLKIRTRARAMRINGRRVSAANSEGTALLRVTPRMLAEETVDSLA